MSGDRHPRPGADDAPPPPYTETDIYSNPSDRSHASVDGAASHVSSATSGDPILTPPASPVAGSYFDTRPGPSSPVDGPSMVHCISVLPDTIPEHLPYNGGLASRDVTEQDWATFRNYLLPDHISRRNDELVSRKLRDEARSEDGTSTRSEKSHAEVQLGKIHSSSDAGAGDRMNATQLRAHAVATVQEWNAAFFNPRGITIQLNPMPQQTEPVVSMPGAWDPSFEERSDHQGRGGWRRHLDRVKVTDNMLRIGDSFVADVNGLKIGSMVMDGRGIRMDGSQPQPAPGFADPMQRGFPRGGSRGGFARGNEYGHGHPFGGWRGGRGLGAHSHSFGGQRGRSFCEASPVEAKERSHSVSSSSSSSSSDSAASECSLDDLPDQDDVQDGQLPLYAARLENWVNTPETIRNRQDLADLRAELKMAKRETLDLSVDKKALRKQVKFLRGQWKMVRKEQRRVLKERKRERKMRKRGERRERRERRREVKRSERDMKREKRECRREEKRERKECGGQRHPWPAPYGVPGAHGPAGIPGVPGVPGLPGVRSPAAPHAPPPHFGRAGSWGGIFGNRGIFGPQGSFGPQVSGPNSQGPSHPFFSPGPFGPHGGPMSYEPFNNIDGPRSAPPGAWPEDKKVRLEEDTSAAIGQEGGVMEAPGREQKMKELEAELERRIMALDGLDEGKERREGEKDIEALVDKLDGLRMEADEEYARTLASQA